MSDTPIVRTCIWIASGGLDAARLYTSLLPGSHIENREHSDNILTGEADGVMTIAITIAGTPFQILQAGPHQEHTDMMSISVTTRDQAETDRLWAALTADGGRETQCGWLKDRWGVAWQIVPRRFAELAESGDKAKVGAMMQAMLAMKKLDIAVLEAAYAAG